MPQIKNRDYFPLGWVAESLLAKIDNLLKDLANRTPLPKALREKLSRGWTRTIVKLELNTRKTIQGVELRLGGRWRSLDTELESVALRSFLNQVKPGSIIWDIGAHIGIYTILAAKQNTTIQVMAWEPSSQNFKQLCEHIKLNQVEKQCTPIQGAVHDGKSSHVAFSSLGKETDRMTLDKQSHQGKVMAASLDQWVEKLGLSPDIIKMDIEGAEALALRGGSRLLSREKGSSRPKILLSVHPHFLWEYGSRVEEIAPLLESYGYRVIDLEGKPAQIKDHAEYWAVPDVS